MKRWIIIGIVVIAIVGISLAVSVSPGQVVLASVAKKGLMRSFVEERGKTRLPQTYHITMPSDGRILAIDLKEGDAVSAGQIVARMAPQDLQLAVDIGVARVAGLAAQIVEQDDNSLENTALVAMKSEVEAMERAVQAAEEQTNATSARVDLAVWDLDRIRKLHEEKAAAGKELRDARFEDINANIKHKTSVLAFRAMQALQIAWNLGPKMITQYIEKKKLRRAVYEQEKAAAEAELAQLKLSQERDTLVSPVDGVVLRRWVSNERVLPAGTLLLDIGRLKDLEVEVEVLTEDSVALRVGEPVDIFGPAIGREPAKGTIARIYPEGFTKVSSLGVEQQRVKVIVRFDGGELARLAEAGHRLGSDYRVRVRMYTADQPDAVIIPRLALFRGPGGVWQVFVIRNDKAMLVDVSLGLTNDEYVAIGEGIAPGDRVILAPPTSLGDGTNVEASVLEANAAG